MILLVAPPRVFVSFVSLIAQFGEQTIFLHAIEKTEFLDVTLHLLKGIITFVLDSVAEFSFLIVDGLIDVAGQMANETIYLPFRLGQIIFFLFKIIFGEIPDSFWPPRLVSFRRCRR